MKHQIAQPSTRLNDEQPTFAIEGHTNRRYDLGLFGDQLKLEAANIVSTADDTKKGIFGGQSSAGNNPLGI